MGKLLEQMRPILKPAFVILLVVVILFTAGVNREKITAWFEKTFQEEKIEQQKDKKINIGRVKIYDRNGILLASGGADVPGIPLQKSMNDPEIKLTIDKKLQDVAVKSLENNILKIRSNKGGLNKGDSDTGFAVVLDVHNGEVLTLASYSMKETDPAASKTRSAPFNSLFTPSSVFIPFTAIESDSSVLPLKSGILEEIKKGLQDDTNSLTPGLFKDLNFNIAYTTGVSETDDLERSNNALLLGYAPADNPKIAFAIAIQNGANGEFLAPVAKDLVQSYLQK